MPDHEESGHSPVEAVSPARPRSRRRAAPVAEAPNALESAASAEVVATRPARRARRTSVPAEPEVVGAPAAAAPSRRAARARPATDVAPAEAPAASAGPATRRGRAAAATTAPDATDAAPSRAARRRTRPAAGTTDAEAPAVVAVPPDAVDSAAPVETRVLEAASGRRPARRPGRRSAAAAPSELASVEAEAAAGPVSVEAAPVEVASRLAPVLSSVEPAATGDAVSPSDAESPSARDASPGEGGVSGRRARRRRGRGAPAPDEQPGNNAAPGTPRQSIAPDGPPRGLRPVPRYGDPGANRRGSGAPHPAAARGAPGAAHPAARRGDPRGPGNAPRSQPPDPRLRQPGQPYGRSHPGASPARPGGPPARSAGPPTRPGGPPPRETPDELRPRRGPIVDPRRRLSPEEASAVAARGTRGAPMLGKIAEMSRDRGFGFILDNAGRKRFFHRSAVVNGAFDTLREGQQVHFEPRDDVKGLRAINVRPAAVARPRPGARQAPWERGTSRLDADPPRRPAAPRRPAGPAPGTSSWRSSLSPFRGEPPSASPPRRRRG